MKTLIFVGPGSPEKIAKIGETLKKTLKGKLEIVTFTSTIFTADTREVVESAKILGEILGIEVEENNVQKCTPENVLRLISSKAEVVDVLIFVMYGSYISAFLEIWDIGTTLTRGQVLVIDWEKSPLRSLLPPPEEDQSTHWTELKGLNEGGTTCQT